MRLVYFNSFLTHFYSIFCAASDPSSEDLVCWRWSQSRWCGSVPPLPTNAVPYYSMLYHTLPYLAVQVAWVRPAAVARVAAHIAVLATSLCCQGGRPGRRKSFLTLPTRPGQSTAFLHRQQTVMVMFLCKVCPFKCPPTLCSWPCTRHSRGMTGAQQSNLGYCPYFYITLHISTLF